MQLHIIADEAVKDTGYSRWNNFYVKAVQHVVADSPHADGLYLDGIAFERTTMERVRKAMEAAAVARRRRASGLYGGTSDGGGGDSDGNFDSDGDGDIRVDIHMDNGGGCKSPGWRVPALQFMQHFSYADSLWFGEGFDYWGQDADWWLVSVSGLPYGLTGDMIREGAVGPNGDHNPSACPDPNRWLGLVFGMTSRLQTTPLGNPYNELPLTASEEETLPIWALFTEWGIAESKMIGWWDPRRVVATNDTEVKATVFIRDDGDALIALANFADSFRVITLSSTTTHVADGVTLPAYYIQGFQNATAFVMGGEIGINSKRGWLLTANNLLDTPPA
jgi:hypothetical protein